MKRKAQRLWLRGFLRLLRADKRCHARREARQAEVLARAVEIARARLYGPGAIE